MEEGEEVVVVGGEEGLTRHHRRCGAPTPNRHRLIDDKIELRDSASSIGLPPYPSTTKVLCVCVCACGHQPYSTVLVPGTVLYCIVLLQPILEL